MIFRCRVALAQFAEQRRPVHLRHHHVGDDEVDLAVMLVASTMSSASTARRRLEHRVAARRPARGRRRRAPRPRPRPAGCALAGEVGGRLLGALPRRASAAISPRPATWRGRKMRKVVPLPTVAVAEDEAAGLLDDAVDRREAEAGALADLLGGEERLEDLVDDARARCRCRCPRPRSARSRRRAALLAEAPRPRAAATLRGADGRACRRPAWRRAH